jgi:NAD(P)-dependent dehydrogenase (short-subunit alcohol dehydrogenase family)
MLATRQATELAPDGITVNGVAPTLLQSDRIRRHRDRPGQIRVGGVATAWQ